jgi:hypothetical protein
MRQYGYHSYRGPLYRGSSLDPNGYGLGIELEVNVNRFSFNQAQTVRGIRAERDGSLGANGVEFVFGAYDDIGKIYRMATTLFSRVEMEEGGDLYGLHINLNAANKTPAWRRAIFYSGADHNAGFLRHIARRYGYNSFASMTSCRYMDSDPGGYAFGRQSGRCGIALRNNRVEFRMFKGTVNAKVLVAQMLFTRYWASWIDSIESQTRGEFISSFAIEGATKYTEFGRWLAEQPETSERQVVMNLYDHAHAWAGIIRFNNYASAAEYIRICGEPINEVCNRLSSPQRQRRSAASQSAVVPTGVPVPA